MRWRGRRPAESWAPNRPCRVLIGRRARCLLACAVAIGVGPGIILYGMGQARAIFRLNLIGAPILLVLLAIGIWWDLAVGAAWAIAIAEVVLLPVLIVKAQRAMRQPGTAEPVRGVLPTDQSFDMSGEDVTLGPAGDPDPNHEGDAAPDASATTNRNG